MPTVTLPHGALQYRAAGPAESEQPPVVFVHGFLVNSTLWTAVADRLAEAGVRSYAPDLPLGSHRTPVAADADMSPRGVARMIVSFLEALDLRDVTLVGSDTGGAICQLLLDTDASRVGRLVLTNCDAFENFPPRFFVPLFLAAQRRRLLWAFLQPMRLRALRHSPVAFGLLMRRPRDAALTRGWVEPALADPRIRKDITRFARALDRRALVEIVPRLHHFRGPVRLVWGRDDRFFTIDTANRLAAAFPDGRVIALPGLTTFVSVDAPERVAAEIVKVGATTAVADHAGR